MSHRESREQNKICLDEGLIGDRGSFHLRLGRDRLAGLQVQGFPVQRRRAVLHGHDPAVSHCRLLIIVLLLLLLLRLRLLCLLLLLLLLLWLPLLLLLLLPRLLLLRLLLRRLLHLRSPIHTHLPDREGRLLTLWCTDTTLNLISALSMNS